MDSRTRAAALIACLMLVQSATALRSLDAGSLGVLGPRRQLRGGGGGWMGGIGTEDMISENDAVGAIDAAVSDDNFGSTYQATQDGYMDADSAVYPDDNAGAMWLNQPQY